MEIPGNTNVTRGVLLGPIRRIELQSVVVGIKVEVGIREGRYILLYKSQVPNIPSVDGCCSSKNNKTSIYIELCDFMNLSLIFR